MGWAGDQSGAGYSPSVPMVTEVSKGGGLRSHRARGRSTALAAGLALARSDARASLPLFSLGSSVSAPHTHRQLQKPLLLVSAPVRSGPAHRALRHPDRRLQLRRSSRSSSYGGTSGSKRELEPEPSCALEGRGLVKGVRSVADRSPIGRPMPTGADPKNEP